LFDLKKNKRELLEINKTRGWGSKGKECGRKEKEEEKNKKFLRHDNLGQCTYIFQYFKTEVLSDFYPF
jgi:hypothetical protein